MIPAKEGCVVGQPGVMILHQHHAAANGRAVEPGRKLRRIFEEQKLSLFAHECKMLSETIPKENRPAVSLPREVPRDL